jgi:hypothetical protein
MGRKRQRSSSSGTVSSRDDKDSQVAFDGSSAADDASTAGEEGAAGAGVGGGDISAGTGIGAASPHVDGSMDLSVPAGASTDPSQRIRAAPRKNTLGLHSFGPVLSGLPTPSSATVKNALRQAVPAPERALARIIPFTDQFGQEFNFTSGVLMTVRGGKRSFSYLPRTLSVFGLDSQQASPQQMALNDELAQLGMYAPRDWGMGTRSFGLKASNFSRLPFPATAIKRFQSFCAEVMAAFNARGACSPSRARDARTSF